MRSDQQDPADRPVQVYPISLAESMVHQLKHQLDQHLHQYEVMIGDLRSNRHLLILDPEVLSVLPTGLRNQAESRFELSPHLVEKVKSEVKLHLEKVR